MTERPILFSGPMVRAILEDRKRQTRRLPSEKQRIGYPHGEITFACPEYFTTVGAGSFGWSCEKGVPGDRLWVRETWTGTWLGNGSMHLVYAADGSERELRAPAEYVLPKAAVKVDSWVTPLFMPRWASRITLEITGVRVERLQEISDKDAREEGMESCTPADQFRVLWDSLNRKKHFWPSNPWVWVIEFKRVDSPEASR